MTLWCLLCAPLLLANDLSHMDAFTLNLLENDEVPAVDQDSLGDQAVTVSHYGDARVYAKNSRMVYAPSDCSTPARMATSP
jgi:alpha-galactosidase